MTLAERVRAATGGRAVRRVERVGGGDINEAFRVQFADESFAFVKTRDGVAPGEYAAEAAGLAEPLLQTLNGARLVITRGPKARGAAATHGIEVHWDAPRARITDIVEHLADQVDGRRVIVQRDDSHVRRSPKWSSHATKNCSCSCAKNCVAPDSKT